MLAFPDGSEAPDEDVIQTGALAWAEVDGLKPVQRCVVRYRYLYDMTAQEIGDALEISRQRVYEILREALRKLRIRMIAKGYEWGTRTGKLYEPPAQADVMSPPVQPRPALPQPAAEAAALKHLPLSTHDTPKPSPTDQQVDLHRLCERWITWRNTRQVQTAGPPVPMNVELAAFHLAYTSQPNTLEKQVFDLYYVHRVTSIQHAASALGMSQLSFDWYLASFRTCVMRDAKSIEAAELRRLASPDASMPHQHLDIEK